MKNVRATKLGLAIWGSGPLKGIAIAVIAVIALMVAGEGLSGGIGFIYADEARKREVLSRGAKKRRFDDAS
jgi:hypothetical protein